MFANDENTLLLIILPYNCAMSYVEVSLEGKAYVHPIGRLLLLCSRFLATIWQTLRQNRNLYKEKGNPCY